jgi:3-oxoacyl-[acyl-carrier protein] reductase
MKYIIVTGSSKGLGLCISKKILERSDLGVISISRTKNSDIENLTKNYGERFKHILFDLRQTEEIKNLYLKKLKPFRDITGLVNNAATAYDDILTNANLNSVENMFKLNVFTPIMLSKYIIRHFLLYKLKGSLVHISSVSTKTGYKGLSMYASTKGALEAFSLNTAREWGSQGIRSNCVVPGFMETDMSSSLSSEQRKRIYKRTALNKATDPESVAGLVNFLLSDEAGSITGEVIRVDNGTI